MSDAPLQVLIVGDDAAAERARDLLERGGAALVEHAAGFDAGVRAVARCAHDAVVVRSRVEGRGGVELVRAAVAAGCRAPVLLLSRAGDGTGSDAVRAGADDVLVEEELTPALLERSLRHAVERRRVEEELSESRRALSTLLGNLPGMAYRCRVDPYWTVEFASDGCRGLTGYAPDELVGNAAVAFADLIHPADRARVHEAIQAARAQGRPFEVEYRLVDRAGRERWVREHGVEVDVPGGGTPRLEGLISDVTERRLAEAALRRSGDYFRSLIETAGEVVAVGNADGTLRYVSPAIERVTGSAPAESVGRRIFELVHPGELPALHQAFRQLLRQPGGSFSTEVRLLHRDGWARLVELSARNLLDDPAVGGIVYNLRDVTERRESEEELRRRERHFRSLIERGQDVIMVLDGDCGVRFASPSVERVLGYGPGELAGADLFGYVHPDDVPAVVEVLDRALRSPGEPQWTEFRMGHLSGGWRTLETIATSLLHDPAVEGIVVNARDVTERKQAEEALRRSQEQFLQAQKMEAVGRLAGGVAHDFNNLLTAIRGNAELLLFDIPEPDPRREDVEEIRRAAERAAALTRQLLAFSRRQVLQPRVLDLNAVVHEMERMLRRLIGEDVELATRLDAGLAPVRADPGQLEQVLLNLAVNARDAMPGGGTLTVETRAARLEEGLKRAYPYVVPGEYVLLAVSDTGHGMDPETLERAFEPFFTTKPAGRGTGLGLSTVYGIVKQSGGFIWVDSEPGAGTMVRIYLPPVVAEAEREAEPRPGAAAPAGGAETILLAEDEEPVRRLARRVLERGGYTVLEASDGEEALRVAEAHPGPIDLLLTDVVMPRLGGRELAARLAGSRPGLRVLYVSGYTEEAVRRHGVLDPGTGFIEKPFTAEALTGRVRRALDQGGA